MAELKIGRMTLGIAQTNCYFVYREGEGKALVFDPADQGGRIYSALQERGFSVEGIFLTHAHFDHIFGVEELREKSGAKLYACENERTLCGDAVANVSDQVGRPCTVRPDVYVRDGEEVTVAGITCRVLATPGHTEGSCCYYFEEAGFLISGDTLFLQSVGRTDFPTGDGGTLLRSIREKLLVLPDEVKVYPGHGDFTSIGAEKQYNPYCQ